MAAYPFESRIQDIVYNVDVGIGLRLIKGSLYGLLLLVIMVVYTATQFRGLKEAEAMDYAQLGRNLMTDGKFVTQCIRPASLWYLMEKKGIEKPPIRNHPDILHPPLYPLVLSWGFRAFQPSLVPDRQARAFPPEQWVIVPIGLLCSLLTGWILYLMGKRLFDRRVALLGATIYFLSDAIWGMSISGLNISLATLLTTLAFYTAIVAAANKKEDRPLLRWGVPLALSVACCVLAFLTRYATAVVVPALALFIAVSFRQHAWKWAAAFMLIFLLGISPWLIRNVSVSGGLLGLAPYAAFNGADPVVDNTFDRSLTPTIDSNTMAGLQLRWMTNLATFYSRHLRTIGDGFLICFFITTFFYSFTRDEVRLFRWCVALAMVLFALVAAWFGEPTMRLIHMFWPIVILYSVAFYYILLERMQLRIPLLRLSVSGLLILLTALPLIFRLLPPRASVPYPPYFPPYIAHVCRMISPDELLCTDMPWATAWYGARNSLLLPQTVDEFYEIHDIHRHISGIYFTTITRDQAYVRSLLTGNNRSWFPILEGRIPADFPLTQGFPLNNLDQLFLTDRPRWLE
jgi:hypothetical protein